MPAADFATKSLKQDTDDVTNTDRFLGLSRTGIPSDPLIVFRKNREGKIEPTVVVGSDLPLNEGGDGDGILKTNAYTKTWWLDVE